MKNQYSAKVNVTLNIPINIISECNGINEARSKALNAVFNKLNDCDLISNSEVEWGEVKVYTNIVNETIMNDTNNHDKELVKLVNDIFNDNSRRDSFVAILDTLLDRDEDEVNEMLSYKRPFAYGSFFEGLKEEQIYSLIHEYLMHVADDMDLQTIISFCR